MNTSRKTTENYTEILLGMGLKVWAKGGLQRIYINSDKTFLRFAELANLDNSTLKAHAHFVKRISNNKTWFDVEEGKFESKKVTVNTLFKILEI